MRLRSSTGTKDLCRIQDRIAQYKFRERKAQYIDVLEKKPISNDIEMVELEDILSKLEPTILKTQEVFPRAVELQSSKPQSSCKNNQLVEDALF